MYVDKKLASVAAVQTLSRLNRTYPGKDQTFVIDFVNDPEDIKAAFQPYYETAELADVSDPNLIHDLQTKLDASRIYTPEEVDGLVLAFFKNRQGDMQAKVAPAVDRYRVRFKEAIEADDKEAIDELVMFRKDVGGFIRAYDFLSQIVDFADTDLEKRSIFFKHLFPWLKDERSRKAIDLSTVKLTHYRLSDKGKQPIKLEQNSDEYKLQPITSLGSGKPHDPETAMLAQIIQKMNDLFEGDLTDNDLLALANHVGGKMMESETLAQQAAANTKEQFGASPDYKAVMLDSVADGLDKYAEMAKQVLNSQRVQDGLSEILLELVYAEFAKKRAQGSSAQK
jgi:type I restriction enzyme R subunit